MTDLPPPNFSGPLEDRMAIRELLETYADATYRCDEPVWASLWTEDATWTFPHIPELGTIRGKERLVELWRGSGVAYPNISVGLSPGMIHVIGDTAVGRFYVSEIYEGGDGRAVHGRPYYEDSYVKRDGRWFIRTRTSTPRKFQS